MALPWLCSCHLVERYGGGDDGGEVGGRPSRPASDGIGTITVEGASCPLGVSALGQPDETSAFALTLDEQGHPHLLFLEGGAVRHRSYAGLWLDSVVGRRAALIAAQHDGGGRLHLVYRSAEMAKVEHTVFDPAAHSWGASNEVAALDATSVAVAARGGQLHVAIAGPTFFERLRLTHAGGAGYQVEACGALAWDAKELSVAVGEELAVASYYSPSEGRWLFPATPAVGACDGEIPIGYSPPNRHMAPAPVAIDAAGVIHFLHVDDSGAQTLYHGTWDGLLLPRPYDATGFAGVEPMSVAIASRAQELHLSFSDADGVWLATRAGSQWTRQPVAAAFAWRTQLRLAGDGAAHVAFVDEGGTLRHRCIRR